MPATRHTDARKELYETMTHVNTRYMRPGSQSHGDGQRRRAARFGRATQNKGSRIDCDLSYVAVPATAEKHQRGVEVKVEATATNSFTHSPGRTIYNGRSDSSQREMHIDPALLAIDEIAEHRLKQKQWLEFVTWEGPLHWAHPDSLTQTILAPRVVDNTPLQAVSPGLSATAGLEGEITNQAEELEWAFETYIRFE